jgi:hypothetical protein
MSETPPHLTVVFELAGIVRGSDIGTAEIYFEGWIDDGTGKRAFRIPHKGYVPDVADGQTLELNTPIFDDRPHGPTLTVHIEGWDEDLGRNSKVDPDDLLGTYEETFSAKERWGVGRHASIPLKSDKGEWMLTYRIDAKP